MKCPIRDHFDWQTLREKRCSAMTRRSQDMFLVAKSFIIVWRRRQNKFELHSVTGFRVRQSHQFFLVGCYSAGRCCFKGRVSARARRQRATVARACAPPSKGQRALALRRQSTSRAQKMIFIAIYKNFGRKGVPPKFGKIQVFPLKQKWIAKHCTSRKKFHVILVQSKNNNAPRKIANAPLPHICNIVIR